MGAGVLLFAEEPSREQVLLRWQRDELQADCDRINGKRREENPDLPDADLLTIEQLLVDEEAASVAAEIWAKVSRQQRHQVGDIRLPIKRAYAAKGRRA